MGIKNSELAKVCDALLEKPNMSVGSAMYQGKLYHNVVFVGSKDAALEIPFDKIDYDRENYIWLYFYHNYLVATRIDNYGEQKMSNRNIKITVEVDGKVVPLETISTETFEKIKAAAKEPEYEGVYVGNCDSNARVFFRVTDTICQYKGEVIALNSKGRKVAGGYGVTFRQLCTRSEYDNIKKLGE